MFSLIACVGKNRELGEGGKLVFQLKDDMKFFQNTTMGHSVLMGRKTWDSLPSKLSGRKNIVISRHPVEGADKTISHLKQFIDDNKDTDEEIFVIGGGMVYFELLPYAKNIYLTELDASAPAADSFFPNFDKSHYNKTIIKEGAKNGLNYSIIKYIKGDKMKDLVFDLINSEKNRQSEGLELIPSENYVSSAVLEAMGSVLTNKYSEGYPSFEGLSEWNETKIAKNILPNSRYYGGQENIDRIERLAISRACKLFRADHANVQPHSGANANEAVYYAWCEPGDKILAMSLPAGGHLTHGAPVTRSAKIYNFIGYGVTEDGDIDYDDLEQKAVAKVPKIILVGYSAFMKIPDFARIAALKEKLPDTLFMADMAHVAGLIAGGVHPNPLDYGFHVITTTTHKTLRGPRGGLILSKGIVSSPLKAPEKTLANIPTLIDRAVFPGTQGGPLEHIIAAKAVSFGEAMQPEFREYAAQILKNAKTLASELQRRDFILQGGGTDNHLILIDTKQSFGIDGKLFEVALDKVGLTLNANSLPSDKSGSFRPSGVRLGTPATTTRGLGESEMEQIAAWMRQVADICKIAGSEDNLSSYQKDLATIHAEVKSLCSKFPTPTK